MMKHPDYEGRVGRFAVSVDILDRKAELIQELFGKMIIVHAEAMYHSRTIHYIAYSKEFAAHSPYLNLPWYDCIYDETKKAWSFVQQKSENGAFQLVNPIPEENHDADTL